MLRSDDVIVSLFQPKIKPLKPVPGTWKKDDEKEENISKNKAIERCDL